MTEKHRKGYTEISQWDSLVVIAEEGGAMPSRHTGWEINKVICGLVKVVGYCNTTIDELCDTNRKAPSIFDAVLKVISELLESARAAGIIIVTNLPGGGYITEVDNQKPLTPEQEELLERFHTELDTAIAKLRAIRTN